MQICTYDGEKMGDQSAPEENYVESFCDDGDNSFDDNDDHHVMVKRNGGGQVNLREKIASF